MLLLSPVPPVTQQQWVKYAIIRSQYINMTTPVRYLFPTSPTDEDYGSIEILYIVIVTMI